MQMVILAGGLGTRRRPLTERLPKRSYEIGSPRGLEEFRQLMRVGGLA